jgi:Leucine-rich repeat (LRR) protein
MCHTLQKLDLRNNEIEDEDNFSFLASLPKLKYINISSNPVVLRDNFENSLREYLGHVDHINFSGE